MATGVRALSLVALLAGTLRLAFVLWARGQLTGDSIFYHLYALAIRDGHGFVSTDGSPGIMWPPGWPTFLAGARAPQEPGPPDGLKSSRVMADAVDKWRMRLTNGMGLRSLSSHFEGCAMGRFRVVGGLVREFGLFLKEDRTWWLAPIFVVLLGLGAFIIFVQGSALAPFIYALF